jgi:prepilin-type N-terminal cleavage/methylation domain-containing protein
MKNKLKAFTLLELLIGMIVSGIVMSAIFAALNIVHRQQLSYEKTSEKNRQLSFFLSTFNTDFAESRNMNCPGENEVIFSSPSKNITYDFHSLYALRKSEETDTFFVSVPELKALKNSEVVGEGLPADELQLSIEISDKKELFELKKFPDAKTKLEEDDTYDHFMRN